MSLADRIEHHPRAHRRSAPVLAALLLAAAPGLPLHAQGPSAPSAQHYAAALDYVVSARYVELLDGIVNRFAAGANVASDPDDLAMKRRVVRDMSREVMADSLARSLAADTPIEVLRAGAAYARSEAGRIEFACVARMAEGPEGYDACLKAGANAAQLQRIADHAQTESGLPLMGKLLKGEAVVAALNASTGDLVERDAEIAAQLAGYCKRKPDEGMCGYRSNAGGPEAAAEGNTDERR